MSVSREELGKIARPSLISTSRILGDDGQPTTPSARGIYVVTDNSHDTVKAINDFISRSGLQIHFHKKNLTEGCFAAINERADIHHVAKPEINEIKTRLMCYKAEGKRHLIAIHTLYKVGENGQTIDKEIASEKRGLHLAELSDYDQDPQNSIIPGNRRVINGKLNPITMYIKRPDIEQYFDSELLKTDGPFYTNAGHRNYGIRIDKETLHEMIRHMKRDRPDRVFIDDLQKVLDNINNRIKTSKNNNIEKNKASSTTNRQERKDKEQKQNKRIIGQQTYKANCWKDYFNNRRNSNTNSIIIKAF